MKKLLIFLLFLILHACRPPVSPGDEPLQLDFDAAIASSGDISLSAFADSVEYIPLETNDSCLLGVMPYFQVYNDCIIASNGGDAPCVFDRRGKFLNRIGRTGKGPGELYMRYSTLHYNPATHVVTFYFYNSLVMFFDIGGRFIRQDTLPRIPDRWDMGGTDRYTAMLACSPDSSRIYMVDRSAGSCRLSPHVCPTLPYRDEDGSISSFFYAIKYNEDHAQYYSVPEQKLYRFYYDGRVENPYLVKLGLKTRLGNNVTLMPILDTPHYLFTGISISSHIFCLVYRKDSKTLLCMNCADHGFINDLDSGFDFYAHNFSSDARTLFRHFDALEVKEKAANSSNPELRALAGRLNDDDNPVLMLVTLKK